MIFEMGAKLEEDDLKVQGSKAKDKTASSEIMDKKEHNLVFQLQKRNGKPVTLVGRFYLSNDDKKKVLKLLKNKLATGGTIDEEWLEIQGDKKDKIKEVLLKDGWKFKN